MSEIRPVCHETTKPRNHRTLLVQSVFRVFVFSWLTVFVLSWLTVFAAGVDVLTLAADDARGIVAEARAEQGRGPRVARRGAGI